MRAALVFVALFAATVMAQNPTVYNRCDLPDIGAAWIGFFAGFGACPNPRGCIIWNPCRAQQLDGQFPGASRFYWVHENGHVRIPSSDERATDCWAAKQMAQAGEIAQLRAAIAHFRSRGNEYHPRYDTMNQRAERLRRCATEAGARGLADEEAIKVPSRKVSLATKRAGLFKELVKGVWYMENFGIITQEMKGTVKAIAKLEAKQQ